MPELPHMPLYVADWLLDTQDLSPEAYQAYHRLLCNMWLNRSCALPHDQSILRNRAGFSPQKWPSVWRQIADFFEIEEGQVGHQKLSRLRSKARSSYEARAGAGRKGARAKWSKNKKKRFSKANGEAIDKRDGNQNQTGINTSAREARDDFFISSIKSGKRNLCQHISAVQARRLVADGRVTEAECQAVGVL